MLTKDTCNTAIVPLAKRYSPPFVTVLGEAVSATLGSYVTSTEGVDPKSGPD
jgi:hypothetical protein